MKIKLRLKDCSYFAISNICTEHSSNLHRKKYEIHEVSKILLHESYSRRRCLSVGELSLSILDLCLEGQTAVRVRFLYFACTIRCRKVLLRDMDESP